MLCPEVTGRSLAPVPHLYTHIFFFPFPEHTLRKLLPLALILVSLTYARIEAWAFGVCGIFAGQHKRKAHLHPQFFPTLKKKKKTNTIKEFSKGYISKNHSPLLNENVLTTKYSHGSHFNVLLIDWWQFEDFQAKAMSGFFLLLLLLSLLYDLLFGNIDCFLPFA